jgi:hypothetical protein
MALACSAVPPRFVVLPDIQGDMTKTLEMSREYAKKQASFLHMNAVYLGVAQGNTHEEFVECATELLQLPITYAIGIPRLAVEKLGSRQPLVKAINSLQTHRRFSIHLLGFSTSIVDDLACCKLPGVVGIDSSVPLRMGQQGKLISQTQADPGPRGNWWTERCLSIHPATLANLYLIRSWIKDTN